MNGSGVVSSFAYTDLREWLVQAEKLGEVRHVHGATWEEDIGLAAEAMLRAENGPCVVFDGALPRRRYDVMTSRG